MADPSRTTSKRGRWISALLVCTLLPAAPLLGLDAYPMTTISETATSVG